MRTKSPIKIKLLRLNCLPAATESYKITQITGDIIIGGYNGQILRAGDAIDEKQAEALTRSYLVTVVTK